jgi:4-hydroxy-tetrahydrodipicolinate synthase
MINAALEGDFTSARAYNKNLLNVYNLLFAENNPAGVKAFLAEMGIIKNKLRLPLVSLSSSMHDQIKQLISDRAKS